MSINAQTALRLSHPVARRRTVRWDEVIQPWRGLSDDSDRGIERCLARPSVWPGSSLYMSISYMDPVVGIGTVLAYEV